MVLTAIPAVIDRRTRSAAATADATILAELVLAHDAFHAVWPAFTERRFERVKVVVVSSERLCKWLVAREHGDVPAVMGQVYALIAQPA